MERLSFATALPLFDTAATRRIEAAAQAVAPAHALMQRAGLAVARLALAVAPHARTVWVACGPGNNGGDGLEAAVHLQQWGKQPVVTLLGDAARLPPDAAASLQRAREAGVAFADAPPAHCDLAIDALLGIGAQRPLEGRAAAWRDAMAALPVLAVDLPSGLHGDTGAGDAVRATHTLSLLTRKPGLFTAGGRDARGELWFDDLGVTPGEAPTAWLNGRPTPVLRPHASHKGSWGDVAVVGGAPGMVGAALLAATAALHGGAGRVFVALLDGGSIGVDTSQPELMFRAPEQLDFSALHLACGCGGGGAVRALLPRALSTAKSLVLDADALNAVAGDASLRALLQARGSRGTPTVLTPHPLEAARLLAGTTAQVQADRLAAAQQLAADLQAVVLLKGSGTVIAAPGALPRINPTGNARLATSGTGDVLAGMVAARMAAGAPALEAASAAAYLHGLVADDWNLQAKLTASALAAYVNSY